MLTIEQFMTTWRSFSRQKKLVVLAVILYCLRYFYKRAAKMSFKDKIVLVTGGGMGIGKLMCEKLRTQGAIVVIWDINESALSEMEQKGFHTYMVDVTNRAVVFENQKKVKDEIGVVDVLINNAGIVCGKPLMELTEKQVNLTMGVNCISHFWTCQAFLPDMIDRRSGHIVTISSIAGFDGLPGLSDYCASKFACRGFAESLRRELHGTNVKSTIIHPFVINTGMFHGTKSASGFWKLFGSQIEPDYAAREILNQTALGRTRSLLPLYSFWVPAAAEMIPWWARDLLAKKSFDMGNHGIQDNRKKSTKD